MIKSLTNIMAFTGVALAAEWDYKQNGADWPAKTSDGWKCHTTNQSPIDLPTEGIVPEKTISAFEDHFGGIYSNIKNQKLKWDGHTNKMMYQSNFDGTPDGERSTGINGFQNMHNFNQRNTAKFFRADSFHWHSKSEHTVDGNQFDLEFHVVHAPSFQLSDSSKKDNSKYLYGVIGIFFDTAEEYNTTATAEEKNAVDQFMISMAAGMNKENDEVSIISMAIGNLMQVLDFGNRWTYEGSLTTPPCSTSVQWNVLKKVLPISKDQLAMFKKQLSKSTYDLESVGNFRSVQAID